MNYLTNPGRNRELKYWEGQDNLILQTIPALLPLVQRTLDVLHYPGLKHHRTAPRSFDKRRRMKGEEEGRGRKRRREEREEEGDESCTGWNDYYRLPPAVVVVVVVVIGSGNKDSSSSPSSPDSWAGE